MTEQATRASHGGAIPEFLFTSIVSYASEKERKKQTEAWRQARKEDGGT